MTHPLPPEWDLPDTEVCSAAWQLVFELSPPFIANHCARSYVFAREVASATGLRAGIDYDDELVFLACVLHDLGVTAYGTGDQRFEVEGADAAVRFIKDHGITGERATKVWQAIALHTSVGLADRFGPEQRVAFLGISLDINGLDRDRLSPVLVERINTTWPRQNLGYAIADLIAQGTQANPLKAPPLSFPAHVTELVTGTPAPSFFDILGWDDRPDLTPRWSPSSAAPGAARA